MQQSQQQNLQQSQQQNLQQSQQQNSQQNQNQQTGRKKKQKQKKQQKEKKEKDCNCRGGIQSCPLLNGRCWKEKNVIYVAKVLRLDNFEEQRYTGMHEGPFKTRIYVHNTNFKNRHNTGTRLSKYVWKLKDNKPHQILYEIKWEILGKEVI